MNGKQVGRRNLFTAAISYPAIDPVLIELGPLVIRWYSLAYIVGLILGWRYIIWLISLPEPPLSRQDADDFLVWATLGVIFGGRIGYTLFYRPEYYLLHPLDILFVWKGGMSFHGGLLGMAVMIFWFSHRRGLNAIGVGDYVACAAPIGLFFGRIANFINGELYGRPSNSPWAMVFPAGGPIARHPSQIYEALLEGILLFGILVAFSLRRSIRIRRDSLLGIFLLGYGLTRTIAEFFREPDLHIGLILGGATIGQVLSLPLIVFGSYLLIREKRHS